MVAAATPVRSTPIRPSPATGRQPATPIDLSAWGAVYDFSDDDEGLDESKEAPAPTAPAPPPGVALASTPPRQRPQATPRSAAASLRHDGTLRAMSTQHATAAAEAGSPLPPLKRQPPCAADHTWQGSLGRAHTAARDAIEHVWPGSLDRAHTAARDVAAAARAASEMLAQRELWATFGGGLARACHRRRAALAYAGACVLAICAQRGTVRGRLEPDPGPGTGPSRACDPHPNQHLHLQPPSQPTPSPSPAHARSPSSRSHTFPPRRPHLHPPLSRWRPLAVSLLQP